MQPIRPASQLRRRTLFGLLAAILGGQRVVGAAGAGTPAAPALPAADERRRSCFVWHDALNESEVGRLISERLDDRNRPSTGQC